MAPVYRFTFTWHTFMDARTCRVCRFLSNRIWVIHAPEIPRVLSHAHYGDVYDVTTKEPMTHGYGPWNCRCNVTVETEFPSLMENARTARSLWNGVNSAMGSFESLFGVPL